MSTEEALRIYPEFAKAVFGSPKRMAKLAVRFGGFTFYSATTMKREIQKLVVDSLKHETPPGSEDEPMLDNRLDACKTQVLITYIDMLTTINPDSFLRLRPRMLMQGLVRGALRHTLLRLVDILLQRYGKRHKLPARHQ